jgi:hypothetical protein
MDDENKIEIQKEETTPPDPPGNREHAEDPAEGPSLSEPEGDSSHLDSEN